MPEHYMKDSSNYHSWIVFAKNDLLVARELDIEKHFVHRAVLTHCQQAIEKYLKAFLLFHNEGIQRTHDLLILCKRCEKFDESFMLFMEDLTWVSVQYLQSRYPDDFEDIELEDTKKTLEIAIKFEEFILPEFG